jgi:hypothetical protein
MDDAWENSMESTLVCSARDIQTTIVEVNGPTSCAPGETIVVGLTIRVVFPTSRYDFSTYTLSEDTTFGTTCAVDILGQREAELATGRVVDQDSDTCYDIQADDNAYTLEEFQLQENLRVPCQGAVDSPAETVTWTYCHGWRTAELDADCIRTGVIPSSANECQCGSLDLGIHIGVETPSPTKAPTSSPSAVSVELSMMFC